VVVAAGRQDMILSSRALVLGVKTMNGQPRRAEDRELDGHLAGWHRGRDGTRTGALPSLGVGRPRETLGWKRRHCRRFHTFQEPPGAGSSVSQQTKSIASDFTERNMLLYPFPKVF
jgi:hypothetical protein